MDRDFWLSALDYIYICAPFPVTSLLWVPQSCPRGLQLSEILIQLPFPAHLMESRLVLAQILAIKHNDLHILSGEKVITLHLEELVSAEFGRPVTVLYSLYSHHYVKAPVLRVQCVVCSPLHTAWFCRSGLLLHMLLTEPKPSGLRYWMCGMDCWVITFLMLVCF